MIPLAWLVLMLLLGLEVAAALLHIGWLAAVLAPAMVVIVVTAFMKIRTETPLSRVFAAAGLFWLAVMLGMGSIDFAVRRNVPVPRTTSSAAWP